MELNWVFKGLSYVNFLKLLISADTHSLKTSKTVVKGLNTEIRITRFIQV